MKLDQSYMQLERYSLDIYTRRLFYIVSDFQSQEHSVEALGVIS